MRRTIRVWKVTEFDVTLETTPGMDVSRAAVELAAQGHTTDTVGALGVIDRGTFPVIKPTE